jgi:predicted MFS family arabinose efflux permease
VFLLQPIVLGAWFPRIPQIQENIGLSEGALAFALIGMPLGLLAALSFGGRLAEALGTRVLLTVGLGAFLVAMPLPAFAFSGIALFAALAIAGVCMAVAQLSLNVTASEVEARSETPIMNGCHGFWSIGVLIGSGLGAGMAELRIAPGLSLLMLSAMILLPILMVSRSITDYALPAVDKEQEKRVPLSKPLICIALFAFGIAMTEGAMADWLAVFMTKIFAASPGVAGASYTVFALSVALGRFRGDKLKTRFAVEKLARVLVGLALLGLLIAVLSPSIWVSFVGVAVLGFGVSLGFPLAVSAVSQLPGRSSAGNVAILTQMTLCGFLVGPPMIGLIAEISNMRVGLAALIPALGMAFVFARALNRADEN